MPEIILGPIAVVCAVAWIKNKIALMVILHYIVWKELPPPNTEDLKYCSKETIKHLLGIKD